MEWNTPSRGRFSFEQMIDSIREYIEADKNYHYTLIIGADSHKLSTKEGLKTRFISSFVITRNGKGGQYYTRKKDDRFVSSLRQQIYMEATDTLMHTSIAEGEFEDFVKDGILEIIPDVDVGHNGKTKELVKEIQGMFVAAGFSNVKIKPYSHASSAVADKHSR